MRTLPRRLSLSCFFFQAEDGIRDVAVTGVQTCALPISSPSAPAAANNNPALKGNYAFTFSGIKGNGTVSISAAVGMFTADGAGNLTSGKIGRGACRERG